MKKHYIKYFLVALILLGISGGCQNTSSYLDFTLLGYVWWGNKAAIGDSVEAFLGDSHQKYVTKTDGEYSFIYRLGAPSGDAQVSYKVRAMDSLGVWSGYKEGVISSDNTSAVVDFHL